MRKKNAYTACKIIMLYTPRYNSIMNLILLSYDMQSDDRVEPTGPRPLRFFLNFWGVPGVLQAIFFFFCKNSFSQYIFTHFTHKFCDRK